MSVSYACTACAVGFPDVEAHNIHYKSDWHRYNLRRKVAGLAPVGEDDFGRRLASALSTKASKENYSGRCAECRKSFKSRRRHDEHLQSKKHKEVVKTRARSALSDDNALAESEVVSGGTIALPTPVANPGNGRNDRQGSSSIVYLHEGVATRTVPETLASNLGAGLCRGEHKLHNLRKGEREDEAGVGDEDDEEQQMPPMGETICIFCDAQSSTFEDNCSHMLHKHGFFIPDVEYLVDPQGLIGYVEGKVKVGNICLWCNGKGKTFHSYQALQQHMTDRAHCKLLYEEYEDLAEYEEFYDFSPSYEDADSTGLIRGVTSGETGEEGSEGGRDVEARGNEMVELSRTLGVTDIGELVLLDGKTVGNRKWNRYYRQRLKSGNQHEAIVAQRRTACRTLGTTYANAGVGGMSSGGALALQRGQRIPYGGLPGVAGPKDVRILRAHQRSEARQRLKTGLRQNKLNRTYDRVLDM